MATTETLTGLADVFPVGTSVSAYPAAAHRPGGTPTGTSAETQNVTSSGTLTYTTLASYTSYTAYAQVSGQHRYVDFMTGPPTGTVPTGDPGTNWATDKEVEDAIYGVLSTIGNRSYANLDADVYTSLVSGTDYSGVLSQALIDTGSSTLFIPSKTTQRVIGDVPYSDSHQTILGAGGLKTTLLGKTAGSYILRMDGKTNCHLRDLTLDGSVATVANQAPGLRIRGQNSAGGSSSQFNTLRNVYVTKCTNGVVVDGSGAADQVDKNKFYDVDWVSNTLGLWLNSSNAQEQELFGCSFSGNDTAVRLSGGSLSWYGGQVQHAAGAGTGVLIDGAMGNLWWLTCQDVIFEQPIKDIDGTAGWPRNGVALRDCVLQGPTYNVHMGIASSFLYAADTQFNSWPTQGTGKIEMAADNCVVVLERCVYGPPAVVVTGNNCTLIEMGMDANPATVTGAGATDANGFRRHKFGRNGLTLGDGASIAVGSTAGTKIGTATSQKLGFYNATPVIQRTLAVAATDAATTQTLANSLRQALIDLGLGA